MATGDEKATAGMMLGTLLAGIVDQPLPDELRALRVTGVHDDSRRVRPGGVFVAMRGTETDGRRFVDDAFARGAAVVIGEGLDHSGERLVLNVPDARAAVARLAARWHGLDEWPAGFHLLGITGTNGKTTTAYMVAAILRAAGRRSGLLGTVEYDLCGRSVKAPMTTPGPIELADYVRECIDAGGQAAVMEVSSHALAQRRADGLRFSAAALTNLTQDHLDYHGTFEAYVAAKARLFARLDEQAVAVVNRDDPHYEAVLRECRARVVTYALERDADISGKITSETSGGTRFELRLDGATHVIEYPLVGRYNVYNALAAVGLARAAGLPTEAIERGLLALGGVPGRLQCVDCLPGVEVFVDYAHTDDALRNVCRTLKPLTRGRLIVVFGCGGDRDRAKRPLMARAVAEFADAVIVTSDNPRGEDPRRIIDDALAGFDDATRERALVVEPDRGRAIHAALAGAEKGDVVLIAGKGHEDYQVVGGRRLHFDDVEAARAAAAELGTFDGES